MNDLVKTDEPNRAGYIGTYLTVVPVFLAFGVFVFWPDTTINKQNGQLEWNDATRLHGVTITSEARLLILVLLSGALGSYVHAATSFTTYVGNRSLVGSWTWWYFLRPLIGTALALVFYFVVRGGLLSAGANAAEVSPFGIAAVAGLVGMFSKQATDKLRETFDNLFRTADGKGDDVRGDKLRAEISVDDCMIPINKITMWELEEGQTEADVDITEIHKKYGGIVTRLPIIDHAGVVKHVVHQSLIYEFISSKVVEKAGQVDIETLKLKDFLEWRDMRELVSNSLVFVAQSASLGDAKTAMEQQPRCQDVFVTEHGVKTEDVKGWLTNVDIGRLSEA